MLRVTEHELVNQAQREQIIKDETWVKGIKSFYQQVAFYCERLAQRNKCHSICLEKKLPFSYE